jgi:hypothetical protein
MEKADKDGNLLQCSACGKVMDIRKYKTLQDINREG